MAIVRCSDCGTYFKAKGIALLEVLSGGKECPECGGNVNLIMATAKRTRGRRRRR
ncbi:MAG: hypothetical protein JRD89_05150 [Deltaproteobacteria bacterium]|nr:hypothetical protein [Deltaproteobacteria bacterium]